MPNVVILGAGISGLSLAYFLKKRFGSDLKITLLEKESRVGGLIKTQSLEDFSIEWGPKSIKNHGKGQATLDLIEELQVQRIELCPSNKQRYLLRNQKLKNVMSLHFFKTLLFASFKDLFFKNLYKKEFLDQLRLDHSFSNNSQMSASYDETIYDFFCHHFGKSFTLYYVDPLVKGIFGGSLKELSMRACFGDIYEIGEKSASLILGFLKKKKEKRNAPYSFLGGMQQLPLALSAKLSENIFLNWDVETIKFDEGLIKIRSQNGQTIECTHLFSTLPAPVLKLKGINICELDDIKFRKIKVFTFCYNKKLSIPEGFGYLVPQMEKEKILGVVFDSSLFDFPKTQLTVMAEEGVMQFEALDALKRHLYISHSPLHIVEHEQKLPQYTLGHLERVKTIEEKAFQLYPNFKILGNSFFGVSINDLILYSKKIAYDFS